MTSLSQIIQSYVSKETDKANAAPVARSKIEKSTTSKSTTSKSKPSKQIVASLPQPITNDEISAAVAIPNATRAVVAATNRPHTKISRRGR